MHLRTSSSRSRDGNFRTNTSPLGVPRTIRTFLRRGCSSAESLCSDITFDCVGSFSLMEPAHHNLESMKYQESQPSSKEPTSSSTAESQERKERQPQARNHPKYDGWCKGHHKSKNVDKIRILHRGEEIENCTSRPFRRMELGSSSRRDLPPRNPKKILLQRRCTEPLPMAARKACMQDLGYFEDGRKTVLLKRFLPLPTPPFDRVAASSDQSCSSMPLRMPVRKASMEEVRLGCSSRCSQAPQKPMNTTTTRWC